MTIYKKTQLLSVTVLAVTAVTQAEAHDITDAYLTDRSANCADYAAEHTATATDIHTETTYSAKTTITTDGTTCLISSNAVPNHDFNTDEGFRNAFSEQVQEYTITATPYRE